MEVGDSRRGQVTLFVILGIVLLVVFGFAIYARGIIVQQQMQEQAEQVLTDFIQTGSITYYVESCLERASIHVLEKTGLQGGMVNQTGILAQDFLTFNDGSQTMDVTYGVVPNIYCPTVQEFSPSYPRPNTYLNDLPLRYDCSSAISGFFGYHMLPKLCFINGANSPSQTTRLDLLCESYDYSYYYQRSIQGRLEQGITKELLKCVDFSLYQNHNISFEKELANSTVVYGFDQITVIADFPFEVNLGGRQNFLIRRSFSYSSQVRLKQIYDFVARVITEDMTNHTFNLSRDYSQVPFYDSTFNVTVFRNACVGCTTVGFYDDILRVEDPLSRLDNKSFIFQTALRNRRPALDYIHEIGGSNLYDIQAIQNETILLLPKGYDPDDTDVTYTYTGWKETEDADFDFACASTLIANNPNPGDPIDFSSCVTIIPGQPRNWTNSNLYRTTRQHASYNATTNDTGPHEVTITITDEEGLDDFQVVKILVFDLPKAVPNGSTGIPGLRDDITSIEDPYWLNASHSQASMIANQQITNIEWRVQQDQPPWTDVFFIATPDFFYKIPHDNPSWNIRWNRDFKNIHLAPFDNIAGFGPSPPSQYNLSLTVTSGGLNSPAVDYLIDVLQCIPYKNRTKTPEIASFSYPYNQSILGKITDSTRYDHTCCAGTIDPSTGVVYGGAPFSLSSNTRCFNMSQWGGIAFFIDNFGISPNNEIITTPTINYLSQPPPLSFPSTHNYYNDIYERTYKRSCDGLRGNICAGPIVDERDLIIQCNDPVQGEDERCQGPSSYTLIPGVSDSEVLSCINYDAGRTFEQSFGLNNINGQLANGVCNEVLRCSTPGFNYDDGSTQYLTNAVCGGGNCGRAPTVQLGNIYPPATVLDCDASDRRECIITSPYPYVFYDYSCTQQPSQPQDACTFTPIVEWTRCEAANTLGSRYCDGSSAAGICSSTQCCDANPSNPPCNDPCSQVNSQCVVGGVGNTNARHCSPLSCDIRGFGSSCDIGAGTNNGFCDSRVSATPTQCTLKYLDGSGCTDSNQCQSGICSSNICIP